MKEIIILLAILSFSFQLKAQSLSCTFKKPVFTIDFGAGNVRDIIADIPSNYGRVQSFCPTDGHYTYASYTSDCFSGDWLTLTEDHTSGDQSGNMLLVNSSYTAGTFFRTTVVGLKGGTTYEFGAWLMNVCKPSDKCPYPLLPDISIRLQSTSGKTIALFNTGEVERRPVPHWTQHRAVFTTPVSETSFILTLVNKKPGGCGNDFALDDITFRECVQQPPLTAASKRPLDKKEPIPINPSKKPVVKKGQTAIPKPVEKKIIMPPVERQPRVVETVKRQKDTASYSRPKPQVFPAPPTILRTRENTVVKRIEAEPGEITINLYDNGEIDGDTVSIYHNNVLLMAHARLSQKPVSIRIAMDEAHPYHEIVMVAENLGSIPPNTSLMVVTAGATRQEVFISSNEQRNAKVVLRLKE